VFARTQQPQYWFSNNWQPCKQNSISGARVARREIYDRFFRQWHWRIAGEQLIYSHVDRVDHFDNATPFRWELNTVRQLLMAGQDDNFQGSNIFDATRTVASLMVHTPGESMFLANTGHSMHIERPAFVAAQIVRFLDPMIAAQTMSFQITCIRKDEGRIKSVGGMNRTLNTPFQMAVSDVVASIGLGNGFFVVGSDGSHAAVRIVTKHQGSMKQFIETVRDSSRPDNLLSLPDC
jgi:hypothetical protein